MSLSDRLREKEGLNLSSAKARSKHSGLFLSLSEGVLCVAQTFTHLTSDAPCAGGN